MKPFIINDHGRVVFPCNFFPDVDFSVFQTLEQFTAVISRDFGEKALTESEIGERLRAGKYQTRYELSRDLALNLFWANRYTLTMYEKRPIRWGDLPQYRDDVFLQPCKPWEAAKLAATLATGYGRLPAKWDEEVEDESFRLLLEGVRKQPVAGGDIRALTPTVGEMKANPQNRTIVLSGYDPDYPGYGYDEIINYDHEVPELVALTRQAMILHNQYRWDASGNSCVEVSQIRDEDYVVALYPRNPEVLEFIRRVRRGDKPRTIRAKLPPTMALSRPVKPYEPVSVRDQFEVMPRLESIAVYEGEVPCTNADLIRNHAYCWSRMTESEIADKTGILERRYSQLSLEEMALLAAREALEKANRKPSEIGAVLFCSCTATKLIPSTACWISGELGIMQTHTSCDIVAACAGMPYGFAEAIRVLQEVKRPVLVILAEKFSDKIGTVRTSRMIFGDGAAAVVIAPAPKGAAPDIEYFQTYASGPWSEVNSIIWPNPEFGNSITVYGPEVKALVARYLSQMMKELRSLPAPEGKDGALLNAVDVVVPHQANKNMVVTLAEGAGMKAEQLYFNIERVGNTSAASILMAIRDAVLEGRIDRRMRVFAPGFGAGAVGGYLVLQVDPAIVSRKKLRAIPEVEHEFEGALAGRVALVTRTSADAARAIALELGRRGASVALNFAPGEDHGDSIAEEIRRMGIPCMVLPGNVAKKADAQQIVNQVIETWHRLDVLVNHTSVLRDKPVYQMNGDWEESVSGNLNSTFNITSAVLPSMINQRFGRIVNISSVQGCQEALSEPSFSTSKGGVIAFTKTVALETAKYNITANVIAPGYTLEDAEKVMPEQVASHVRGKIPLGRFATAQEVAKAAAFLASDADYITGQELNVNGGYHM